MRGATVRWTATVYVLVCTVASGRSLAESPPPSPGDGRHAVPSTPHSKAGRFTGLLYFDDPRTDPKDRPSKPDRIRRGTAFLVSDKHIVTCAHCITNVQSKEPGDKDYPLSADFGEAGFASNVFFAPGHQGMVQTPLDQLPAADAQPFGRYRVVRIAQIFKAYFVKPTYLKPLPRIAPYDLVVLELDRSTRSQVGGHFKINEAVWEPGPEVVSLKLHLNGYDADLAPTIRLPGGQEGARAWQFTRSGTVDDSLATRGRKILSECANLTCKAMPGASGGPIWVDSFASGPTAIGIILKNDHNKGDQAIGLFFNGGHVEFLKAGISSP